MTLEAGLRVLGIASVCRLLCAPWVGAFEQRIPAIDKWRSASVVRFRCQIQAGRLGRGSKEDSLDG
jgi:hypothetical protein